MRVPLLWHFVKQDILTRYTGSVLGALWLLANPLVQILIYMLVFGTILGGRVSAQAGPYAYVFYLMAGVLPWTAFSSTITRTASVFLDKAGVITKVELRLPVIALHVALSEGLVLAGVLLLLIGIMALLGKPPSVALLTLPLLLFTQQLIAFCLGLLAAMVTVFLRDTKEAIGLIIAVWFWLTPIVYQATDSSHALQALQGWNPASDFIQGYHHSLVTSDWPDFASLARHDCFWLVTAAILIWGLGKIERDIRDLL